MNGRTLCLSVLAFAFTLLLLLVGCQAIVQSPMPTTSATMVAPQEVESATVTPPVGIALLTPTQTATRTPSPTLRPTRTPRPTSTSTLTPLPTLASDQALSLVMDLLMYNGGCQLPCWWGFTPGVTKWEVAQAFLATFASKIATSNRGYNYSVYFSNIGETPVGVPVAQDYIVQEGVIEVMRVGAPTITAYDLPNVLSTYGEPEEVWVYASESSAEVTQPFNLILFYPRQGFMILYLKNEPGQRDPILGCFQELDTNPSLWLWSPTRNWDFQEAATETYMLDSEAVEQFLPLETATGMDIETFVETFSNPSNLVCLETPAELWR